MWEPGLQPAVVGAKESFTTLAGAVCEGGWMGGPKRGLRQQREVEGRPRCSRLPAVRAAWACCPCDTSRAHSRGTEECLPGTTSAPRRQLSGR